MKYQNLLSRWKYALVCKTQSSVCDPNSELWVPHNMKCLGLDLRVQCVTISDKWVQTFCLDTGHVNQIPSAPGVSRTITGFLFMPIDFTWDFLICHVNSLGLMQTSHLIFQFPDDGAPESSQITMSIGNLTYWNFGDKVRRRDFQHILPCVSLREKHEVLESIWK